MNKITIVTLFFLAFMPLKNGLASPYFDYNGPETASLLNPDKFFEELRKNITIPISSTTEINIPSPEQSIKDAAKLRPKIDELTKTVEEESGVNIKKLFTFLAKMTIGIFKTVILTLESLISFLQ